MDKKENIETKVNPDKKSNEEKFKRTEEWLIDLNTLTLNSRRIRARNLPGIEHTVFTYIS